MAEVRVMVFDEPIPPETRDALVLWWKALERVMDKYLITKKEIEQLEGISKTHFLNKNAKRINKSLGDLTGLTGFGFHIIEIQPGHESTEFHKHYHEDECVFILEGEAEALIGEEVYSVKAGDFIGYRAGGDAHSLRNTSDSTLKCIVVGQRLEHKGNRGHPLTIQLIWWVSRFSRFTQKVHEEPTLRCTV